MKRENIGFLNKLSSSGEVKAICRHGGWIAKYKENLPSSPVYTSGICDTIDDAVEDLKDVMNKVSRNEYSACAGDSKNI